MSSFLSWLPESGWSRLLCDALWQSTLIAAVGCITARFLTHQSAARAWLLLLTLTACLFVPLASMAAREAGWTIVARRSAGTWPRLSETRPASGYPASLGETRPRDFAENETMLAAQPKTAPATPAEALPGQAASAHNATTETFALNALGIVWLTASTLLMIRLALSFLATWRLIRRAAACDDAGLKSASAIAAQRVGLAKPPMLLVSSLVRTPTIFALGRPRLLIPADDASRVTTNNVDWTAAFTHELAHVARRDGWSRLWVEIVLIALPLQPLVWLARRAFRTACEEACDDWAVATGSNPVDLADMLATWMYGSGPKPTLLAIGMSSTKARTLRLLSLYTTPSAKLTRRWRWAGIPATLVLVSALAVAQSPNERNQEEPSATAPAALNGSSGQQASPSPYIIQSTDFIEISPVRLTPKQPMRVMPGDQVHIAVQTPGVPDTEFDRAFDIRDDGDVVLTVIRGGFVHDYGYVKINGLTADDAQELIRKKLATQLKEPHVVLTIDESTRESQVSGQHGVGEFQRRSGILNLGVFGIVKVDGLTIADARAAIEKALSEHFVEPKVAVDVNKNFGKFYYVIVGDNVARKSTEGDEKVLDMMSKSNLVGVKSISIKRPISVTRGTQTLVVRWNDVLHGDDTTNYQILPGDRIFIEFEQPSGGFGGDTAAPRPTAAKPNKP